MNILFNTKRPFIRDKEHRADGHIVEMASLQCMYKYFIKRLTLPVSTCNYLKHGK